jgi:hypothetical protein
MVVPDTRGSSVCTMLDATLLGPKVLRWPQDFWNICASTIMTTFRRREQLMQFLIFALNNKCTTDTCSCSSNRLHVQEPSRAFINENPKSASFLAGKYKNSESHTTAAAKEVSKELTQKSSTIDSGHISFEKVKKKT